MEIFSTLIIFVVVLAAILTAAFVWTVFTLFSNKCPNCGKELEMWDDNPVHDYCDSCGYSRNHD